MKRVVIVLGALLVLGTIGLVVAIVLKPTNGVPLSAKLPSIGSPSADALMALPPLEGREVIDTTLEGANLVIRLLDDEGIQEIWVIDLATGDILRKFAFAPDP